MNNLFLLLLFLQIISAGNVGLRNSSLLVQHSFTGGNDACEGNVLSLSYIATDPQIVCADGQNICRTLGYKGSTIGSFPYFHYVENGGNFLQKSLSPSDLRYESNMKLFRKLFKKAKGIVRHAPWPDGVPPPPNSLLNPPEPKNPCTWIAKEQCWVDAACFSVDGIPTTCWQFCPLECRACGVGCAKGLIGVGPGDKGGGGTNTGASNRYPCNQPIAIYSSTDPNWWVGKVVCDNTAFPSIVSDREICHRTCTGVGLGADCCGSTGCSSILPLDLQGCSCDEGLCFNDCSNKCGGSFCNYCACDGDLADQCRKWCTKCNNTIMNCDNCICGDQSYCDQNCDKCNLGKCSDCDCQNDITCKFCPKCIAQCELCRWGSVYTDNRCAAGQCDKCPHCIDCHNIPSKNVSVDCFTLPDAWCPECPVPSGPANSTNSTSFPPIGNCDSTAELAQCGFCPCNQTWCTDSCGTCCAEKVLSGQATCANVPFTLPDPNNKCQFRGNVSTLASVVLQSGQTACFKAESAVKGVHGHIIVEKGRDLFITVLNSWVIYPLLDGYYIPDDPGVKLSCECECIKPFDKTCEPTTNLCHGHSNCMNLYIGNSGGKGCIIANSNTCCRLEFDGDADTVILHLSTPTDIISEVLVTYGNWSEVLNVSLLGTVSSSNGPSQIKVGAAGYLQSLPFPGNMLVAYKHGQMYSVPDYNSHNTFTPTQGGWLKVHSDVNGNPINGSLDYASVSIAGSMFVETTRCWGFEKKSKFKETMDLFRESVQKFPTIESVIGAGQVDYQVGQLRGQLRILYKSGNPVIITINATSLNLEYYERTIHVATFSCTGTGDIRIGVTLNCSAVVDTPGGTVYFWQVNKDGNIVKTETVFAPTTVFTFDLHPDLAPSSNMSKICTNGANRDLCINVTYHVNTDPIIIPDWSVPVKALSPKEEFGGLSGKWNWWNPFSWFDEGELAKSIVMVIVYTIIALVICICLVACCVLVIYLGPEVFALISYLFGLITSSWKLLIFPWRILKGIKMRLKKFKEAQKEKKETESSDLEMDEMVQQDKEVSSEMPEGLTAFQKKLWMQQH